MIKMACIYFLSALCGALIIELRTKPIGKLHIEHSSYGTRVYVTITGDYNTKRPYVRLNVIHETVPDEDHEKYILKEKE